MLKATNTVTGHSLSIIININSTYHRKIGCWIIIK